MNTYRTGNISIADFRLFLSDNGLKEVESGNTGHEKRIFLVLYNAAACSTFCSTASFMYALSVMPD